MNRYLVVRVYHGEESCSALCGSFDEAIQYVKTFSSSPYFQNEFKIYSLSSPLTVRYLDNKIFID